MLVVCHENGQEKHQPGMRSLSIPRKSPFSKTLRNTFRSRYDGTWSLQTQISSLDPGGKLNRVILIHYHEINLKRNNRSWFENRLKLHLESPSQRLASRGNPEIRRANDPTTQQGITRR